METNAASNEVKDLVQDINRMREDLNEIKHIVDSLRTKNTIQILPNVSNLPTTSNR